MIAFKRPHSSVSKKDKTLSYNLLNNNNQVPNINSPSFKQNSLINRKDQSKRKSAIGNLKPMRVQQIEWNLDINNLKPKEKAISNINEQYKIDMNLNVNTKDAQIKDKTKILSKHFSTEREKKSNSFIYQKYEQSDNTKKKIVNDYMGIIKNRQKKLKDLNIIKSVKEEKNRIIIKNFKMKNKCKNNNNNNNQKKDKAKYRPLIIKDNKKEINGHMRFNDHSALNVRNRLHQYYNKKIEHQETLDDIKKENDDMKLIKNRKTNEIDVINFRFSKKPQTPLQNNNNKIMKMNMNINQRKEQNKESKNSYRTQNSKREQPAISTNKEEIETSVRNPAKSDGNINNQQGNNNFFNKKTNLQKEILNQRESDLNKFILFTEALSPNEANNKNKITKNYNITQREEEKISNRQININTNKVKIEEIKNIIKGNHLTPSFINEMKLNPNSKAFIEEKLKQMREKMDINN